MTLKAGIVCGKCDHLNQVESRECSSCGSNLNLRLEADNLAGNEKQEDKNALQDVAPEGKEEEPMEQARHLVCSDCYSPIPSGHKFCGKCGKSLEDNVEKKAEFFGDLQSPGKARLILIKGEGVDGMSYHLNSSEHIAGRSKGEIVFADDQWLSPAHANFQYKDGKIVVNDEQSLNGVFVAETQAVSISPGTVIMAGEQVFRVEDVAPVDQEPEDDGTYFFASPFSGGVFRIVQVLEGGGDGMVVNPKENSVVIGREDCDMNFPSDPFISGSHLKVESSGDKIELTDLNSKNGTFVKIDGERELAHGDYLFLGRQLLRVEITS